MDKSIPVEAKPLRPDFEDDDHSQTVNSVPTSLMVSPLDDTNKDSNDADAGPSTGPIKRGRGRPKGSKNSMTTTPLPLTVTPMRPIIPFDDSNNNSDDVDAGPSSVLIKRGRGRPPKGSKNSKTTRKKPKAYDHNSNILLYSRNYDSGITEAERETGNQEIVDMVLIRFDAVRRRLYQINHPKDQILTTATTSCKSLGVRTNTKRRIGPVPGVQEGHIFYSRAEMSLVGLHIQMVGGIDYMGPKDGAVVDDAVATSVVTSGHFDDETEELDTLIYTGQGGTDKNGQPCDQKMEKGNLALEASIRKGNEVRVIRGVEDSYDKKKKVYIYDGLYLVYDYWTAEGKSGFKEFKFKMVRNPDTSSGYAIWTSAENLWKHGLSNSRNGFILEDLSYGIELLRVPLVNEVDENDKTIPEDFAYIRSLCYSTMTLDINVDYQSFGCQDCQGQSCVDHGPNCKCMQRNDGELPYLNSLLVSRKPLIYECGESCPCPDDCKSRLVQTGLRIRVEVFKTANCGWGLRSWEPIRAGTFICEFAGVSKTKEQVEEDDDYLFDTCRAYNEFKYWNYEPELVGENAWNQGSKVFNLPTQVLISAKEKGNVGRFMNHSCSPNVLWQPIEYEQNAVTQTRIGFFAMKHIPPLTELTYDYGVSCVEKIGEDERLINKGKKICLCASANCRGSFG